MRRTEALHEVRQMRFEEIYGRHRRGRLSGLEAAEWLGVSERTLRRPSTHDPLMDPVGCYCSGTVTPAKAANRGKSHCTGTITIQ